MGFSLAGTSVSCIQLKFDSFLLSSTQILPSWTIFTSADTQRYVQKAPDDIRWFIDRTEFDELIALKKDSAPGLDGIVYCAKRCGLEVPGWGLDVVLCFSLL